MGTLQAILTIILAPAAVVAVGAFVFREIFRQLLARDIENHKAGLARDIETYKARLQAESEQTKIRLQNDLQIQLFEYQTRFSLLHTKRADVIIELYGMLTETHEWIREVVHPVQSVSDEVQVQRSTEAGEKFNTLMRFFQKHRPYLDEDVCAQMDGVLKTMREAFTHYSHAQRIPEGRRVRSLEMWHAAYESLNNDVPPILKALERQFRRSLSADVPDSR